MEFELTFHNHEKAFEAVRKLIEENYVVTISRKEDLIILNYEVDAETILAKYENHIT